jgi:hypothetical protein
MREQTLRDFFAGVASAQDLAQDVEGSVEYSGPHTSRQRITDMDAEFAVRPQHLVRLCDAVLAGALPPEILEPIGFCLVASDRFIWDGDDRDGARVAEVAHDWSAPQVNYVLNQATVAKFRHFLLTGEQVLDRDDLWSAHHTLNGVTIRQKDQAG